MNMLMREQADGTQHHELHRIGEIRDVTRKLTEPMHSDQRGQAFPKILSIQRKGRSHSITVLLVEFDSVSALKNAARRVRDAGFKKWDTYSPFPVHGIDKAMGLLRSRIPWFVLACGITGCLVGLFGQWWLNSTSPGRLLVQFQIFSVVTTFRSAASRCGNCRPTFR